ncbi:MAG: YicC/YloC family endoribonuclease [Burkholderiaceae bacterium]
MNLHSMTGFALVRRDRPSGSVVLEIRSVNSRFLDPQFRISEELRAGETVLREALTTRLSRGKLDCRFYIHRASQSSQGLKINTALVEQLGRLDREVRERLPSSEGLRVYEVLHWPGVLEDSELSTEETLELARSLAKEAIDQLLQSRAREGSKLREMLLERVSAMEQIAGSLAPRIPQLVAAHQQKLVERLTLALNATPANLSENHSGPSLSRDEALDRIRQEVTLFGVRIDVAEELTRLAAHLTETRRILDAGGACGKRLDFMMQELNREANTLGSKSAAAELADAAMDLKLLIEQMREQVQNLE